MKLIVTFLTAISWLAMAVRAEDAKPNILFIFADDWGWGDLSCHGHPYLETPNIDRLAREGTDFHRFTVASGVCSPSRAAVMTGHFPARYNIDGHFAWVKDNQRRGMPDWLSTEAPLLPRFLKQAGYSTAHFGKWHLANNMIPDSPLPTAYGYDEYGAFNCAGEQMPFHEDAMHVISFMEKCNEAERPFFINLWIHEPHTPFHVLPKYQWRFQDLKQPDNIYASVISHADDRIGRILDTLDRLGITDNTLVVFTSDNGPARAAKPMAPGLQYDSATGAGFDLGAAKGITGGRKGYKASLFEGGIGVPFIARWPGKISAGEVDRSSLISAVDLLPTFCEIAGVELPADYQPDGLDMTSVLKGEPVPAREKPLFWKVGANRNTAFHWAAYAVVDGHWKMLSDASQDRIELYDLSVDELEEADLSDKETEVKARMLGLLKEWRDALPSRPVGDVFSATREK
ncbi:sulfatase family protein [Haloferula sp.]|uniref:sulfatase family protein n=1 Tax=Haloferula sp. TaxID=2497595 RepID=UPI003C718AC8